MTLTLTILVYFSVESLSDNSLSIKHKNVGVFARIACSSLSLQRATPIIFLTRVYIIIVCFRCLSLDLF